MTTRPHRHGIPPEILALSQERDQLRKRGQYDRADELKLQLEEAGYAVKDNPRGAHLVILPSVDIDDTTYRLTRLVPSHLDEADTCDFSIIVVAANTQAQTRRCIESVLRHVGETNIEIWLVDNASRDGLDLWTQASRATESRLHVISPSNKLGAAEARNIALKQCRGRYILLLDNSIELTGNIFLPLAATLADPEVGITGLQGWVTADLRHFKESQDEEVEVIDQLCLAFARAHLKQAGLFDEHYRSQQYMDTDFNFAMRDLDLQTRVTFDLPLIQHEAIEEGTSSEEERARLSKRNFYRFLGKWGDRDDLLLYEDEDEDEADTDNEGI
ncbi:glycosyltransferase family 2 protein [Ktedonospora formicarum]|uniref:Glycosyltransferase 2-like domain-containing protein n=1 Tax=Ktedonospora formicarum TaxID=2778364 RepID=A0A8J3MTI6_9CHLR|nr:glycosyltransferase [Ktedonospora formicarum]GHO45628.1 hypothetical protein KSX_37910 [Ktedonospora formicarum]